MSSPPDASAATPQEVVVEEARTLLRQLDEARQHYNEPFAKGGDRHWLWWADSRSLRPGLYLRRRRILRVSMWLLRPRYSWNVRGYGRRWT